MTYCPLPVYRGDVVLLQVFVAAGEVVVAEPSAAVGGEGRWVHGLEHEVLPLVYERCLASGVAAPEDEYEVLAVGAEGLYRGVGELFPSFALVAGSLVCPHGERGVEQQHSLLGPARQIACRGDWCAQVELYLLENVLQGGRERHSVAYGEAEPVGLARLVVRVLADDYHLHVVERTEVEGVEYLAAWRETGVVEVFLPDESCQVDEVLLLEFPTDVLFP